MNNKQNNNNNNLATKKHKSQQALTFDDVLLIPQYSEVTPNQTDPTT